MYKESQCNTKADFERIRTNLKNNQALTKQDTEILLNYLKQEAKEKEDTYKEGKWLKRKQRNTDIFNGIAKDMSTEEKDFIITQANIKISMDDNIENLYNYLGQDIKVVKSDKTPTRINYILEEYDNIKKYEENITDYMKTNTPLSTDLLPIINDQSEQIKKTSEKIFGKKFNK